MRSSKSRSRNKSNRQRSMGNIVNRVFDSSGPEGKVRGTPQQIIDKYLQLARDAQLGNDRVAEQNFLQHAEHYTRMLGEAQKEQAREQEARNQQRQQNNQNNGNQNNGGQNNGGQNQGGNGQQGGQNSGQNNGQQGDSQNEAASKGEAQDNNTSERREERSEAKSSGRNKRGESPEMMPPMPQLELEEDSTLVETPESRSNSDEAPKPAAQPEKAEKAEKAEKPKRPRAPRKPRAPKADKAEKAEASAEMPKASGE
ncbi:DUF4167 domain-containing protein [Thioclava sp. ES.031]|uniref:DUF4167 domain-containing protein n=1 Tax=Thioclava sp. ES.031 TaxID=1798203 RepID=UPI000BF25583|nr:DUF4167 domain-containing protein [Thioclava sp. ES.031]